MIKIAVNSNKKFVDKTYDIVIDGLVKSGVKNEDIHFFVGGYDEYKSYLVDGVNFHECDNNSIDFTCLIGIVELNLESDFWFVIHDTVLIGPDFYSKISVFDENQLAVPLTNTMSCNMGMYSDKLIKQNKQSILDKKNKDYSPESIQLYKKMNIMWEDFLLNQFKYNPYARELPIVDEVPKDIYGNGTLRRIEYYKCVDLYKIKSNWIEKETYELEL
jgi:hypothetical protein